MTLALGTVPAGTTLYIPFATYAGSTGASATMTGLAVSDVEIYKNGSTTQRASDAGYTLLDTDGIDFDAITGIHGFSVDLNDNTDAGFYAVGSWYWVVVSAVTVDAQTVNFIAAVFRIGPAEGVAGYPKADVSHFGGTAGTFASGRPEVNTSHAAGTAWNSGAIGAGTLAADTLTAAKFAADVTTELQTGLATAAALTSAAADITTILADTNDIQTRLPAALVSGRMDASVGAMAANVMTAAAAAADLTTELQSGVAMAADLATVAGYLDTEIVAIKTKTDFLPSATAGAAGGLFIAGSNAATTVNFTGNLSGSVGSVTGAVGSVTGAVGSVTGLTAADVGAIKAKTDGLTFTVANVLDANVQRINDVTITGNGSPGTEFGV